ncbi:MAG: hypothetical protein NTZ29_16850, partial [Verrucomicrobia bacterium]|nr:hypothetical protein [Verrucomicrobiota bacterium]
MSTPPLPVVVRAFDPRRSGGFRPIANWIEALSLAVLTGCARLRRNLLVVSVSAGPPVCFSDGPVAGVVPKPEMPHHPARVRRLRRRLPVRLRATLGAVVGLGLLPPAALAATDATARSFNIPTGDAAVMLKTFAAQSGEQLLYSPDDLRDVRTSAISGQLTSLAAL